MAKKNPAKSKKFPAKQRESKKEHPYDGSTMLKSVMQETFTDKMLIHNQTDAYLQAYPKCNSREAAKVNASRLLTNANVKARLAYKRAQLAKKMEITEENQLKRLKELSEGAEKNRQYSAAVSAEDRINTICGLYVKDNAQKQGLTLVEILAIVGVNKDKKTYKLPDNKPQVPVLEAPAVSEDIDKLKEPTDG